MSDWLADYLDWMADHPELSTPAADGTPEFKLGGGVPDRPVRISFQDGEPIVRADVTVSQFIQFMAEQDPERLERDRAEAWGDRTARLSPDAMTVTFDPATEQ